jgi:hypothetical protein
MDEKEWKKVMSKGVVRDFLLGGGEGGEKERPFLGRFLDLARSSFW